MRSLRAALTLRLLLGGAVLLAGAGVAVHWQVRRALRAECESSLRVAAQALATLTKLTPEGEMQFDFAGESMPQYERADGAAVFLLQGEDGGEIERSVSLGEAALPMPEGTLEEPEFFDVTLPDGRALLCAGVKFPVQQDNEEEHAAAVDGPQASLVVGMARTGLDHTLATLGWIFLTTGGLTLGLLGLLVRWVVRQGLAPLETLTEEVSRVEATHLDTRFPSATLPVELQPITECLNELLSRLQAAFAREQRFTATAAHELRTPLAELRTLAEVNLAVPGSAAERQEAWQDALASTLRMEALAVRLLALARAEAPVQPLQSSALSLAGAVEDAWRPHAARAAQRHLTLRNELSPTLHVPSDAQVLGIILENLLSNSIAHAPAHSVIVLGARVELAAVRLTVTNAAPDLTSVDLPHLCERFWRKDQARTEGPHHGLGLALAAECATLLGGSLTPTLRDGALSMTLALPQER